MSPSAIENALKGEILNLLDDTLFRTLRQIIKEKNLNAYVIGGYVRDFLLQRPSKDIDIVVEGSGIDLAEQAARILGAKVSVFKNFGTAMFNYKGREVEFVGARRESYQRTSRKPIVEDGTLDDDQKRRDFTINALAISLCPESLGSILDPFGGIDDLESKTLRTPLDPNLTFSDDPLRMIRAARFAATLGFNITPEALEAMKQNVKRLEIVSGERITEELNKMMMAARPSVGLEILDSTTLLDEILPQLSALKGTESLEGRKHKNNFEHTLKVLDNLAQQSPDNLWLRWAALLHDIAKPLTKRYDQQNGWTFHGHEFVGSKMIPKIFKQLRLPLDERMRYVQKLVALHMRPIVLSNEEVTDSAVRRLLFDAGDDTDDLMTLCEADITSKNPRTVAKHIANFATVRSKLKEIEEKDAIRNFQPPVSGELIMKVFGLEPCRSIGAIKEAIKEAILDGVIGNNYTEALELMYLEGERLGLKPVEGIETQNTQNNIENETQSQDLDHTCGNACDMPDSDDAIV
ncbi:MAG: CCA tRNA nucleotidyltransferase [Prevotellaceae bacterium]|jgi:poly(A) polymerase|nr:CCA tRNA nucleotidyltransferase [Prevotellaceae bacterium]